MRRARPRPPHSRNPALSLLPLLLLSRNFTALITASRTRATGGPLRQRLAAWGSPLSPFPPPIRYSRSLGALSRPPCLLFPHHTPLVAVAMRKGADDREDCHGLPQTVDFGSKPLRDRKKRRVALVIGYVGTKYSGLQKSESGPGEAEVITIESVLEKALFDAGYIRESNFGDLDKIGWARCSRTDKGVHAARNVVSAKLELWVDDMEGDSPNWSERAVKEINACLPDDIRVHSCAKATKSFRPRDAVSFREYVYIVPVELLRPFPGTGRAVADEDLEALIARFCDLLVRFQGTHNFHNFTKIKSRDLIRRLKAKAGSSRAWVHNNQRGGRDGEAIAAGGENSTGEDGTGRGGEKGGEYAQEGVAEGEAQGGEEGGAEEWTAPNVGGLSTAKVDGVRRFNTEVVLNPLFQILRASPQNQRARNDPDRRKSKEERGWVGGEGGRQKDDLRVEHVAIGDPADGVTTALWDLTRYQGVLKMVRTNIYRCEGRALQVGGKDFVAVTFHGSSFLYNQIRLLIGGAIAVASGLFPEAALPMALDSPYLIYSPLAPAEGLFLRHITFGRKSKNPVVMDEADLPTAAEMAAANCPQVYALLSKEAGQRADVFERERILTEINGAWTPELLEEWRRYARAFLIDEEVEGALSKKFRQWRESMAKLEEAKAARELFRRQSMATWMKREGAEGEGSLGEEGEDKVGALEKEILRSYRRWMPQRFATDLIIRFRLKPGKQVGNVQRGLAVGMVEGRVPNDATSEELFALMEAEGGVGAWEKAGRRVRDAAGWEGDESEEREEESVGVRGECTKEGRTPMP